jgi:trans-aconitate methyltransferase
MSFDVPADAYAQFMGRFSAPLAVALVDQLGDRLGSRVLDVGCGPGALTEVLIDRLGRDQVVAADPSAPFVHAVYDALGAQTVAATAERLPFSSGAFGAALAQLVVHFMADPVRGMAEMARVTTGGRLLAASVWDSHDGGSPLSTFWQAARDLDPSVKDESERAGSGRGQLGELANAAGWVDVAESALEIEVAQPGFDGWWEPFTLGVGPAGAHVAGLPEESREQLRARCRELLPTGPFVVPARAWLVVGSAPDTPEVG